MRKRIYARESRYLASRFSVYNNPAGKLKILLPLFGSRVCLLSLLRGQERERERGSIVRAREYNNHGEGDNGQRLILRFPAITRPPPVNKTMSLYVYAHVDSA